MRASGDDVRRELIFEPRHLVAQKKFSFLKALHLQLIGLAGVPQGLDRCVKGAVLLAQPLDLGDQRRMVLWREPSVVHLAPLYARRSTPSMSSQQADVANWRGLSSHAQTQREPPAPQFNRLYMLFSFECVKRLKSSPQNVEAQPGESTIRHHFAACAVRRICHTFVVKNMRELSHVD